MALDAFLGGALASRLGHGPALRPHWGLIHYQTAAPLPGMNRRWRAGRWGSKGSKNKTTRFGVALDAFLGGALASRLGHGPALTVHWTVIHHRTAASHFSPAGSVTVWLSGPTGA